MGLLPRLTARSMGATRGKPLSTSITLTYLRIQTMISNFSSQIWLTFLKRLCITTASLQTSSHAWCVHCKRLCARRDHWASIADPLRATCIHWIMPMDSDDDLIALHTYVYIAQSILWWQELGATRKAHCAFWHMSRPILPMLSRTNSIISEQPRFWMCSLVV